MRVAAAALASALAAGCASAPVCPAPEKWTERMMRSWDDEVINTRYVPRAPGSCPGPQHPVFEAQRADADGWIHVVETNVPDETTGDAKTFVDASLTAREDGAPFYTRQPTFWDNPKWAKPSRDLRWEGFAYVVKVADKTITPVGGLRWGFEWRAGQSAPDALTLRRAAEEDWSRHVPRLKKEFPNWTFEPPFREKPKSKLEIKNKPQVLPEPKGSGSSER